MQKPLSHHCFCYFDKPCVLFKNQEFKPSFVVEEFSLVNNYLPNDPSAGKSTANVKINKTENLVFRHP